MYEQLGPNQSVNSRDYAPIHIPRSRHKCSCSGVSVFGTPSMIVKNAFSLRELKSHCDPDWNQ